MTVFTEQSEQPPVTLVGDNAKYKTQADLEQGYTHLNEFAENLKREAAELREELGKRLSVEEQVRALATQRTEQPSAPPQTPSTPSEPAKPFTDEDLGSRIREIMQSDNAEQTARRNADEVEQKLVSALGDATKANDFVNAKARELKVSVSFLLDMAKTSPSGFFKLVDITEAPSPSAPASRSDVNPAAFANNSGQAKPGTYAFYETMRKTDPKTYWLPKTQNQMHRDARSNPDGFGFPKR